MGIALYLVVEVDGDEFGVCVAGDERLVEVERARLVHPGRPFLVHLLLELTDQLQHLVVVIVHILSLLTLHASGGGRTVNMA